MVDAVLDIAQSGLCLAIAYHAAKGAHGGYEALESYVSGDGFRDVASDVGHGISYVGSIALDVLWLRGVDSIRTMLGTDQGASGQAGQDLG